MTQQPDWLTKDRANELAARIKKYWKERGRNYEVWVEPVRFTWRETKEDHIYCVRSDIKFKPYPDFYGNNVKNP